MSGGSTPLIDETHRHAEEMDHDEFSVKPPQLHPTKREKHKHRKKSDEKKRRSYEKEQERAARDKQHSSRDYSRKDKESGRDSRVERDRLLNRQQQYEKEEKRREKSQQERDRLERLERERRRLEHERQIQEREHQERLIREKKDREGEKRDFDRQYTSGKVTTSDDDNRRRLVANTKSADANDLRRQRDYDRSRSPYSRRAPDERQLSPRKTGPVHDDDDELELAWRNLDREPKQQQQQQYSELRSRDDSKTRDDVIGKGREDRSTRSRDEVGFGREREEFSSGSSGKNRDDYKVRDEAVAVRRREDLEKVRGELGRNRNISRSSDGNKEQQSNVGGRDRKDVNINDYYEKMSDQDDFDEGELHGSHGSYNSGREGNSGSPVIRAKSSISSPVTNKKITEQQEIRVKISVEDSGEDNEESNDESSSESGSGSSGSEHSLSPDSNGAPDKSTQFKQDKHPKSKFDSASESEEEEGEDVQSEEEGEDRSSDSDKDNDDDGQDDDGNYVDSPPQSPVILKAELPAYLPALQGCRSVEEFNCLNRIEEGTYGVVYRALEKKTNCDRFADEIVALKRLKMEKEKEGFPITSLREINTLLKAQHPNIVTVREIVVGSNMDKIYIVMDYVEHDLKSLMESMKENFIIGEVKTLLIQLLRGVAHLHDNWIIHRDLKTSNLLLSHKGILKIGDFGLAREYGSPLKPYTPIVVTLWYRAPELLLGAKLYSTAIDMWSVGCIFAELITRKPLFPGKSEIDELNRIFKELGTPTEKIWPGLNDLPAFKKCTFAEHPYNQLKNRFGSIITEKGFDLMNRFLTYDPSRRITAEDALKHSWLQEAPSPVPPSMFPTWPAKSEQNSKRTHGNSPKPPSGGKAYANLLGEEDDEEKISQGFHLAPPSRGAAAIGTSFALKF